MTDRSGPRLLAGVVVAAGVLLAATLPVPYVVFSPGPVFNTLGTQDGKPLVQVSGAPTYPTSGRLDVTTVLEQGGPSSRLSLVGALRAWVDPSQAVIPERVVYPAQTTGEQVKQEGAAQMVGSQDAAAIAALRELKLPVTTNVAITSVSPDGPSDGILESGDTLLAVDGTPVSTPTEAVDAIQTHQPGDRVELRIRRDGTEKSVSVVAGANPDDKTKPFLGVTLGVGYTSPVTVTYSLENVGGPSAGLMFALGTVDKLTPQQETGGRNIAGTGEIDENGNVGAIGGIQQKIRAAAGEGASVFLVPANNCSEALQDPPTHIRLVRVTSLSQALDALAAITSGTGAVPAC